MVGFDLGGGGGSCGRGLGLVVLLLLVLELEVELVVGSGGTGLGLGIGGFEAFGLCFAESGSVLSVRGYVYLRRCRVQRYLICFALGCAAHVMVDVHGIHCSCECLACSGDERGSSRLRLVFEFEVGVEVVVAEGGGRM